MQQKPTPTLFQASANPIHLHWTPPLSYQQNPPTFKARHSTPNSSSHSQPPKNNHNLSSSYSQPPPHFKPFEGKCQWCNTKGHVLAYYPTFQLHPNITIPPRPFRQNPQTYTTTLQPQVHHASEFISNSNPHTSWLLVNGASHHVTKDLGNSSLHSLYNGTDEIAIGDVFGLPSTKSSLRS